MKTTIDSKGVNTHSLSEGDSLDIQVPTTLLGVNVIEAITLLQSKVTHLETQLLAMQAAAATAAAASTTSSIAEESMEEPPSGQVDSPAGVVASTPKKTGKKLPATSVLT